MPTDLPPDYEPPSKKMLDRKTYLNVLRRLTVGTAGPVGLLWGFSTLFIVGATLLLFGEAAQWMVYEDSPNLGRVVILAILLMVADLFRKALYRPLRRLGRKQKADWTIVETARLAAGRMAPVMVVQLVTTVMWVVAALGMAAFGVFGVIPLTIFSFALGPAIYFAATGRSTGRSLSRAFHISRRHGPWVLGIPAVFLCVGTAVGSLFQLFFVFEPFACQAVSLDGGGLELLQILTLSVLYGYMRWLAVGTVYVAIDEKS